MTEVWIASVSYSPWEGSRLIGVAATRDVAQALCEGDNRDPLDWSDPTLNGLFDPSPDVINAEGDNEHGMGGTYSVHRYEVVRRG